MDLTTRRLMGRDANLAGPSAILSDIRPRYPRAVHARGELAGIGRRRLRIAVGRFGAAGVSA